MKDFTKKGIKLPVIPVGTVASTTLLFRSGKSKTFDMGTTKEHLISYGMLDEKWLKCDNPDYNGSDFYLIKLSTIERLAKEQGMCDDEPSKEDKAIARINAFENLMDATFKAIKEVSDIPLHREIEFYTNLNKWKKEAYIKAKGYDKIHIFSGGEKSKSFSNPSNLEYVMNKSRAVFGKWKVEPVNNEQMNPTIKLQENA